MNNTRKTKAQLIDELKIRDALDRVRSSALGMQESEEMKDVVSALFGAYKELGFSLWNNTIAIVEESKLEVANWYAHDEELSSASVHRIPFSNFEKIEGVGEILKDFRSGNHQTISKVWEEDDLRRFFTDYFTVIGASKEASEGYIQRLPESLTSNIVFFNHGWLWIDDLKDTVDLEVVERLGKVFEFAYERFLELKEKEDQNRELTIQNALERVRSRALGMQTSDEIAGVSTALFDEFESLAFEVWSVRVNIMNFESETIQTFSRNPTLAKIAELKEDLLERRPPRATTFDEIRKQNPNFDRDKDRLLEAKAKGESYPVIETEIDRDTYIQNVRNTRSRYLQSLLPEQQERFFELAPERVFRYYILFSQGWVIIGSPSQLSKEELEVAKRFIGTFDFAYNRFLELKAKEEQNRELTIQNSLERIRARALGMQVSDEIAGVATALFDEFENLEFELFGLGIHIVDRETEFMHSFGRNPAAVKALELTREEFQEKSQTRPALVSSFEELRKGNTLFDHILDMWDKGEPYFVWEEKRDETVQRLSSGPWLQSFLPEEKERFFKLLPKHQFIYRIFYSHGIVSLEAPDPLPEENLAVAKRFADTFDFAYNRFRELKAKEEQNHVLLIESATARVRAEATAMQQSADIEKLLCALYQEINAVGVKTESVVINVESKATKTLDMYSVSIDFGEWSKNSSKVLRVDEQAGLVLSKTEIPIEFAKERGWAITEFESNLFEAPPNFHEDISQIWDMDFPEELANNSKGINVPFEFGGLFVGRMKDATPFDQTDIGTIENFAEAVSLGYQRYLDFQRLEEQNKALEEANEQIREATRLKSQFLATMSHELRTPMNAIIGFTRLVLNRAENLADRHRDNLEKVRLSADHLLSLINDILDLSKVEAGRVDIEAADFDVTPVIENCCATVGPTLGKPGVQLIPDTQPNIPQVHTDEARLRQIIINLISNALKFTDKGEVRVTTRIIKTDLQIAVSDTGIGIPEDQLDTIFEEFRQVDGTSTRTHKGTGLGLAITKQLIELLGGHISVTSSVGKGSTFTFTIPTRYGTPLASTSPSLTDDSDPVVLSEVEGHTIISIDDDPNIAVLLRQELEDDGYTVISALNADEGIDLVKKHQPLAVTVDILMPGKDGWQTISQLKADPKTKNIPIIVVSAIENKSLGFSMGVHDYIVKPFDHDGLITALNSIDNKKSDSEHKL